ncbi:MAG: DNA-directed RNA polymerase subunit omega [bacterium]
MIKTLPIKELEKYANNVYEAIIILAKRARQINDEQKLLFHHDMEYDEDFEEEEEEESNRKVKEVKHINLPKPTTIALEEFLAGKIRYDYQDTSEEKEETS